MHKHFNDHLPGSAFASNCQKGLQDSVTSGLVFLWVGRPSMYQTHSVKAKKAILNKQSNICTIHYSS